VVAADHNAASLAQSFEVPGVTPVRADVAVQHDIDAVVAAAVALGGIDIVCNNAGGVDRLLPVGEMTDEGWRQVLDVNLTEPMLLSRAAIPIMLNAGSGRHQTLAGLNVWLQRHHQITTPAIGPPMCRRDTVHF